MYELHYSAANFFFISQAIQVITPSSRHLFFAIRVLNHLSHYMTEGFSLARARGFTGSSYAHNSAQHWLGNDMANISLSDYDFDSFLPQ